MAPFAFQPLCFLLLLIVLPTFFWQRKNQFDFAVVCLCNFGLLMWLVINR
jgi:hypothetical protein